MTSLLDRVTMDAMPFKVMVSSVRLGLAEARDAARPLLEVLGYQPIRFEDITPQPVPSRAVCVDAVNRFDIYLLLLGESYGEPTPDSGLAPTEEEWTVARANGKLIVVFKKAGMTPEPRQAEFIARVESYATGVFRGTFENTADLLGQLRDAMAAAGAALQPMRARPLVTPLTVPWRQGDRFMTGGGGVRLETYLVPVADLDPLRAGSFAELPRRLARAGRDHGLFDEGEALRFLTTEATVAAEAEATGRRPSAGVEVSSRREITVWEALPTQMGGTPFDADVVRSRIARDVRIAAGLNLLTGEEAAVAIALDRLTMLGRATSPTSMEFPFFGRADEPVRLEPTDAVPTAALARVADDIAGELLSRLVLRLGLR